MENGLNATTPKFYYLSGRALHSMYEGPAVQINFYSLVCVDVVCVMPILHTSFNGVGLGWWITSVFFILMVRPKAFVAAKKRSMSSCASCRDFATSAASSAKRRSRMILILVSVFALNLW